MRIALRTSGGRGEYEVAGSHENIKVHDILNRQITLEIIPGFRLHTNNFVRHSQGKPRIRLADAHEDKHIYLILSALLLLPKPKREIGATPAGKLQLYKDNFSVFSVLFDIVELSENELVISPTQMILSNSSSDYVRLDVIERFKMVMQAWEGALDGQSAVAETLGRHREAFHSVNVRGILTACEELRLMNVEQDDPLRYATRALELPNLDEFMWMGVHATETEEVMGLGEENLEDLMEAARNRVKSWRLLAERGSDGARFSREVKMNYRNTCLFTGFRLPKTDLTGPAGVDAAHILPWAEYDLNKVSNGLCLSKLCHWAFDNGIIKLDFNDAASRYELSVSERAKEADSKGLIDLTPFYDIEGDISASLLPSSRANWPNPSFLKAYNEAMNR
ncbi:HNH endonuclease [Paracandidimonas lactea]|uniref:HNH endonuclease n=1 Tax=Paracandidimonas lactea TaxID=2895524 RepID=UPI001F22AA1E|nr:HNH endonuclease [Paracandidimonas lactea]